MLFVFYEHKIRVLEVPNRVVAVVFDALISELYAMPFFSAYFLQLTAKVRPHEHYVPASRLQLLALISSASGE